MKLFVTRAQEKREQEEREIRFLEALNFMGRTIHQKTVCEWKDTVDDSGSMKDRGKDITLIAAEVLSLMDFTGPEWEENNIFQETL